MHAWEMELNPNSRNGSEVFYFILILNKNYLKGTQIHTHTHKDKGCLYSSLFQEVKADSGILFLLESRMVLTYLLAYIPRYNPLFKLNEDSSEAAEISCRQHCSS